MYEIIKIATTAAQMSFIIASLTPRDVLSFKKELWSVEFREISRIYAKLTINPLFVQVCLDSLNITLISFQT